MHRGYTKRWRKRWDKEYHKDHLLWVLMDYFIDHANHKDKNIFIKGAGVILIKRGQHIFGTPSLAEFMGVDRQRIRSKIKILKKLNFLTSRTTNRYTIITVINYDIYNPIENGTNQQKHTQLTSNKPATNQQLTTPNNVNNDKNDKKIKTYPEWLDLNLWKEFKKFRTKIKSPLTDHAEKLALTKLDEIKKQGFNPEDVINQTIECGWKSFYPPKNKKPESSTNYKQWKTPDYLLDTVNSIGKAVE